MRLTLTFAALLIASPTLVAATRPCQLVHGRATYSSTNGMFRIWHIGTHHTFMPDETRTPDYSDFSPSWGKVMDLLTANDKDPHGADNNALYADFLVCTVETFKEEAAQHAQVLKVLHPHIVNRDHDSNGN